VADVACASEMLRELAEPLRYGEPIKVVLDRASRLAKLSYWRTFDIWYRKARQVEDYEFEKIQTALRIKNEMAARNELHDLKLRLTRLEALLDASDSDFHRQDIDFARSLLRGVGGNDRALDKGTKR